jgi:hypothetical protein
MGNHQTTKSFESPITPTRRRLQEPERYNPQISWTVFERKTLQEFASLCKHKTPCDGYCYR